MDTVQAMAPALVDESRVIIFIGFTFGISIGCLSFKVHVRLFFEVETCLCVSYFLSCNLQITFYTREQQHWMRGVTSPISSPTKRCMQAFSPLQYLAFPSLKTFHCPCPGVYPEVALASREETSVLLGEVLGGSRWLEPHLNLPHVLDLPMALPLPPREDTHHILQFESSTRKGSK